MPGYKSGGPVRSISNIISALNDRYEFYVVCLSNDIGENRYKDVISNRWTKIHGANVLYIDKYFVPFALSLKQLRIVKPDIVYFNSLLDPFFTFLQLIYYHRKAKKVIIAPRGELSEGALSLSKLRKLLYLTVFNAFFSPNKLTWHATSDFESNQISKNLFVDRYRIYIANNLYYDQGIKNKFVNQVKKSNRLSVVFLSRISPVKNLGYFLDILNGCNLRIKFDIYGPIGFHVRRK